MVYCHLPDIHDNLAFVSPAVKAACNPLMRQHFSCGLFAARLACYKPGYERTLCHSQCRSPGVFANYGPGLRLIPGRASERLSSLSRATRID
jgi:hypothetical protein